VTEASARIVVAVSSEASSTTQPHSVCGGEVCCATTVENSGVCYLKGVVSVYFRCLARTVGFSGTYTQVLLTSWLGGSTRGLQPGGQAHK